MPSVDKQEHGVIARLYLLKTAYTINFLDQNAAQIKRLCDGIAVCCPVWLQEAFNCKLDTFCEMLAAAAFKRRQLVYDQLPEAEFLEMCYVFVLFNFYKMGLPLGVHTKTSIKEYSDMLGVSEAVVHDFFKQIAQDISEIVFA